jgi:phytoene synthase
MLLGKRARDDAAVLYAWCRRADDGIDEAGPAEAERALRTLRRKLADLFAGRVHAPLDLALRELLLRRRIPRDYFQALLDGFAMDAQGASYRLLEDLDLYGYRVAGVVGLMMCHVLGVYDERCLKAAAHLGMAMQLTNIARDVGEDFSRGRQYLPTLLLSAENLGEAVRGEGTPVSRGQLATAVEVLLRRADCFYASGLAGLRELGWRDALAIGAAARIYRGIGRILARRGFDPLRGRAVVSLPRKGWSAVSAAMALVLQIPRRLRRRAVARVPKLLVRFDDVQG